jgi:iron complex outermembrane receptor protein
MRLTIMALALAGVSAISTAAAAQDSGLNPATAARAPVSPTAPPAQPQGAVGLQEIIVTAQRRAESLQRVPVAVTAVSSAQLENLRVTNVKNLAGLAPSLQIETQGLQSNPSISIRGVASGVSNNAVDPKIGIYLDGVYIGRTTGSIFDLADLERVEVLRGPQGTLFGRNATSGAISLISAAPTGKFGVRATGSYGNYDAKRGKIVVNLPAFGPFSLKIAYLHDEIDGDYRNSLGGQTLNLSQRFASFPTQTFARKLGGRNIDGGQVALRGDFGNLVADYRFDYTDARTVGRAIQSLGVIPDSSGQLLQPIVSLQPLLGGTTNEAPNSRLTTVANATSREHVVTQGHSLTLTLRPNDVLTIKSITAYRKFKQYPNIYDLAASGGLRFTFAQLATLLTPGLTPAQIAAGLFAPGNLPGANDYFFSLLTARETSQRQFSQEVQFQLSTDPFTLTAGVFYFHERSPAADLLGILEPTPSGTVVPSPLDALFGSGVTDTLSRNNSMAEYAQGTLHIGSRLDLTGGLRYTMDDRKLNIYSISGGQGGQLGVGRYHVSYEKLNYTGILTWRPTKRTTAYAKISTGYVSGGILSGIPYKPETLTAYEIGAKTQLFDNRVRLNAAAYYSDYKNLQTQNFISGVQTFDNAGKANIKGFEIEIDIAPVAGLVLSGNVGYADLNYKRFVLNGVDVADIARQPYQSKWTARASAQYDAPAFSNGSHIQGRLEGRYRSSYYLTATPFVDITTGQNALESVNKRPGYWMLDGRFGLIDFPLGGTKASLSAFGDNILNRRVIAFGAPVLSLTGSYERGRTYGLELGFAF